MTLQHYLHAILLQYPDNEGTCYRVGGRIGYSIEDTHSVQRVRTVVGQTRSRALMITCSD